jgi:hypothetical protein
VAVVSPPVDTLGLDKLAGVRLTWTDVGQVSVYDVLSGALADLDVDGGIATATCLQDDITGTVFADPQGDPAPGSAFYYLVRGQNVCGSGTWGFDSSVVERQPNTDCP